MESERDGESETETGEGEGSGGRTDRSDRKFRNLQSPADSSSRKNYKLACFVTNQVSTETYFPWLWHVLIFG